MTAADGILNSPNSWLFQEDDLRYTPSRADGIPYEREMYERAFGVDLIVRVGAVRVDVWVAFNTPLSLLLTNVLSESL